MSSNLNHCEDKKSRKLYQGISPVWYNYAKNLPPTFGTAQKEEEAVY